MLVAALDTSTFTLSCALVDVAAGRPPSLRAREIANLVGIILLVTLMLVVFKNDIARLMG